MNDAMNPYPPAAEAVDGHLAKSIDTLTDTTRDGFNRVEAQMRDMASKDSVNAQVARLDTRIDHIDEKVEDGFAQIKKDMQVGFAELKARDSERDDQFKAREDERDKKYSRRVGWTISAVAIGVSILTFIWNQIFI